MPRTSGWQERIGRRLNLRDLHIFMTVAQRGSMGKAAVELAVSQPAVSKAIAELEHVLGVRLFDRTALGIEPTRYGDALLRWAVVVFDDLRQGVKELEVLADPVAGEIRIGTTEPMAAGLVAAVVDLLTRRFPRLLINVVQAGTVLLQYRDLRERKVDLILGRMVAGAPDDDLDVEVLFGDPFRVVAGAHNPWARRRKVTLHDLAQEHWTLPIREGWIGRPILEALEKGGLPSPAHVVFSNSIQLHNALMATGRFLTVISQSTVHFGGKRLGLKALPIELPLTVGSVGIITLKGRAVSPVIRPLADCAREVARTMGRQR